MLDAGTDRLIVIKENTDVQSTGTENNPGVLRRAVMDVCRYRAGCIASAGAVVIQNKKVSHSCLVRVRESLHATTPVARASALTAPTVTLHTTQLYTLHTIITKIIRYHKAAGVITRCNTLAVSEGRSTPAESTKSHRGGGDELAGIVCTSRTECVSLQSSRGSCRSPSSDHCPWTP